MGAGIPSAALPPRYEPENSDQESRSQLQAYYATAGFIDAQAGLLFDALDRNDLWEDTVVRDGESILPFSSAIMVCILEITAASGASKASWKNH